MMTEDGKSEILIRIGKAVAHLRDAKGLSLRELSNEIEADSSWIAKVEKGKHDVQVSSLVKLATFFQVDICFFFKYEESNEGKKSSEK